MKLEHVFEKNISRTIEGVIKADDNASLRLELDEYVITDEVGKRLDDFLDAYLNYAGANGAWISGFFGSGKSHLLKMLALLLENKKIDGVSTLDIFLNKSKCKEDEIFSSDLKRAVAIPSESILFNIDQKADVISKKEIDALVAVFVKVFDEHCGYYGKQAYIAQFERELDADGLFDKFKAAFFKISKNEWDDGRKRVNRMAAEIDAAYNEVTGQTSKDVLDKYRNDYRLSIEDFAAQVKAYIDHKGKNFRLNFFVDEVGQYVADNVKLMTNLQTVAESLATKCNGQSWVIVTAQEDMSNVVGEVDKQQANDFSKIHARFKNRMKLTSQDVAEVIQRRLLQKKEEFITPISDLFHKQQNNFKTLFDFSDGAQNYKNFNDREHFIQCYPFIPYQFGLFQAAIQGLSLHNAFEGKHSSVGERSMLGVFQQVGIAIKDHELGDLATFDLMFEGIRTALKTAIQQSILTAENQLDNKFAVRLLKALFLVKYVKEFKPTIRNLCVLMHDSFQRDIPKLKTSVEEALNLLEQQSYIQRNGELYEYLTDEEQDIEQAIKNTEVDSSAVAAELEKIIYGGVLKTPKIRWDETGQDYPFSKRLDDTLFGRENELAINVITSFHPHADVEEKHRTDTVYNSELRIVLPQSERLVRDLLMYKQTEKYVAHETRTTQQDSIKRILSEKNGQNAERLNQLTILINKLLGSAQFFVGGQALELSGEDGQSKIIKAFYELIKITYPNLRMLRGVQFNENQISEILRKAGQGLLGEDAALPESEQEMLAIINSNSRGGVRTTVKSLLEKFEYKPYGWSYAAVLCTLAYLCARGKVEVRESTNPVEDADLVRALTNKAVQGSLILEPQFEYTQSQIRAVKEFHKDMFQQMLNATEAKAIAKEIQEAFSAMAIDLDKLQTQAPQYPFLRALSPIVNDLKELNNKPHKWFMTELVDQEEKWFNLKESTIDPIVKFMKGQQKENYDTAKSLLESQKPNLSYINAEDYQTLGAAILDPEIYKGNKIQQLKASTDQLHAQLQTVLSHEKQQAIATIETLKGKLSGFGEFGSLTSERKEELLKPFETTVQHINQQSLIAVIRDDLRRFEEDTYSALVQKLMMWSQPVVVVKPDPTSGTSSTTEKEETKPQIETVPVRQLKISFNKPWLATEADVTEYVEEYKKALLEAIKQGKHIQL